MDLRSLPIFRDKRPNEVALRFAALGCHRRLMNAQRVPSCLVVLRLTVPVFLEDLGVGTSWETRR